MSKYNFGLDLESRNSLSLLVARIMPNSTILEFGPANGRMTKYMKENLKCKVYAVEIDEDAAKDVQQYTEDIVVGNIEDYSWQNKFKDLKFDYIIFADVLEHLYYPEKVIQGVKSFLKDDGSVLISIPNIAHNSILLGLMKNEFNYSPIGLLDDTHIRFFTKKTFDKIISNNNYFIAYETGTYEKPENTEFNYSYSDFPQEIGSFISELPWGEVYQFIYELKTQEIGLFSDFKTTNYSLNKYDKGCCYLNDDRLRINDTNMSLNPKSVDILLYISKDFERNQTEDIIEKNVKNDIPPSCIISQNNLLDVTQKYSIPFLKLEENKNDMSELRKIFKKNDWIILIKNKTVSAEFKQNLFNYVFNPGCIYIFSSDRENDDDTLFFNTKATCLRDGFSLLNVKNYYNSDKTVLLGIYFMEKSPYRSDIHKCDAPVSTGNEEDVINKIRTSGLFDVLFYRTTYADVALSGMDPIIHYVKFGANEGRRPNEWFDTKKYIDKYKDVKESRMNPFYHYIIYGSNEGRTA